MNAAGYALGPLIPLLLAESPAVVPKLIYTGKVQDVGSLSFEVASR
jgi:hypothetical protein